MFCTTRRPVFLINKEIGQNAATLKGIDYTDYRTLTKEKKTWVYTDF